jgi:predicted transcriptional regulator
MATKTISLRVSPDFDRRLRVEAARRDLDRSTAIRQAIENWLSKVSADPHAQPQPDDADRRGVCDV